MPDWDTSCIDWRDRIKSGQSLVPKLPLDMRDAKRALRMFESLRLPDVIGTPYLKTAGGAWFKDIVQAIHGSLDENNRRRITEAFVMVPKKSAKTTLSAALMVTSLLMGKRPRAEYLMIAPTQEVSDLAFRQAVGMIELDEVLRAKFQIQDHIRKITYLPNNSFLKVKSFDPKTVTGVKPVFVLLDELHVIAGAAEADRVLGQLRGGLIANPEACMVTITTQSERPPSGVFLAELRKARAVRDGKLKAPILPVLFEFPEGVDWRDPSQWWMVTPNRGLSVEVERLIPDYEGAVVSGEGELRRWASQHLNVEIGLGLKSDAWAGAEHWEVQAEPTLTLEALLERSEVVVAGVDGGGLDDLLALAVIGRDKDTKDWLHWTHAWAHPVVLERRKDQAPKLRDFERDGDLSIGDKIGEDIEQIADRLAEIEESGLLASVGFDPMGVGAIVDALAERGISGNDRIVGISQGWQMAGSIKTLERKAADGTFWHGGQPIMTWSVGNAKVEPRGNAITITKQNSGTAKIDNFMATLDAVALMSRNPAARNGKSIYEMPQSLLI